MRETDLYIVEALDYYAAVVFALARRRRLYFDNGRIFTLFDLIQLYHLGEHLVGRELSIPDHSEYLVRVGNIVFLFYIVAPRRQCDEVGKLIVLALSLALKHFLAAFDVFVAQFFLEKALDLTLRRRRFNEFQPVSRRSFRRIRRYDFNDVAVCQHRVYGHYF